MQFINNLNKLTNVGELRLMSDDNKILSTINYAFRNDMLSLNLLFTNAMERNKGYARQILQEFINIYGKENDIKLEICPIESHKGNFFKERQKTLAKFYSKFGFETTFIKEQGQVAQWEMIRNKG